VRCEHQAASQPKVLTVCGIDYQRSSVRTVAVCDPTKLIIKIAASYSYKPALHRTAKYTHSAVSNVNAQENSTRPVICNPLRSGWKLPRTAGFTRRSIPKALLFAAGLGHALP
jgi:hypothetical protein